MVVPTKMENGGYALATQASIKAHIFPWLKIEQLMDLIVEHFWMPIAGTTISPCFRIVRKIQFLSSNEEPTAIMLYYSS